MALIQRRCPLKVIIYAWKVVSTLHIETYIFSGSDCPLNLIKSYPRKTRNYSHIENYESTSMSIHVSSS